jgi:hypothetical protein
MPDNDSSRKKARRIARLILFAVLFICSAFTTLMSYLGELYPYRYLPGNEHTIDPDIVLGVQAFAVLGCLAAFFLDSLSFDLGLHG